jgi:hypothetical protein
VTIHELDTPDPEPLVEVIADGTPWIDSEGKQAFTEIEAVTLADHLERMGYSTEVSRPETEKEAEAG